MPASNIIDANFITYDEAAKRAATIQLGEDENISTWNDIASYSGQGIKWLYWAPKPGGYCIDIVRNRRTGSIKTYSCNSLGEAVTFYNLIDIQ